MAYSIAQPFLLFLLVVHLYLDFPFDPIKINVKSCSYNVRSKKSVQHLSLVAIATA